MIQQRAIQRQPLPLQCEMQITSKQFSFQLSIPPPQPTLITKWTTRQKQSGCSVTDDTINKSRGFFSLSFLKSLRLTARRTPLHSSVTVSQLLMDIKHGAEEIHEHNRVSGHLQGRSLAPYICVRTHNCHKITCHYWADRMDSTRWGLMGSF